MSKQLNQKVETKDEELVIANQRYDLAIERAWKAQDKIRKLDSRVMELESLLSQVKGPMESIWIPVALMENLRELAIKKNVSANDLAHNMIINGLYSELPEYEYREKKEKELVTP